MPIDQDITVPRWGPARYERKYLIRDIDPESVLAAVRQHPALFCRPYPSRWVNSVYFDDAGHGFYWNHVNGAFSRSKVRVRWYGALTGEIPLAVLEIKSRRGEVGYKQIWPLGPLTVDGHISFQRFQRLFRDHRLPDGLAGSLALLRPSGANRYLRRYFESADGRVRLTMDTDLTTFDGLPRLAGFDRRARKHEGIIIELKYRVEEHSRAAGMAQDFPFRFQRVSKYITGLAGWDPES